MCNFMIKITLGGKSVNFGKNAILSKKCLSEHARTHIPLPPTRFWHRPDSKSDEFDKKCVVSPKTHFGAKSALLAQKCTFCPKTHFLDRWLRMLIKPVVYWWNFITLVPKSDFGAKSALLAPKWRFVAKRRKIPWISTIEKKRGFEWICQKS